ncbi:hypothetical protein WMY93_020757 [Mugilogobius chulae]|uniref:Uncharacterized protein n=1 Tax=Mugilogobius chulae TaxID=88201 RepID=A0AAW0N8P5_9GOBI
MQSTGEEQTFKDEGNLQEEQRPTDPEMEDSNVSDEQSCPGSSSLFGSKEEGTEAPVMPEETLNDEREEDKVGQRYLESEIDVSGEENGCPGPSAAFVSEEETLINSVKRTLDRIFLNLFSEEETVCVEEEEKHRSLRQKRERLPKKREV